LFTYRNLIRGAEKFAPFFKLNCKKERKNYMVIQLGRLTREVELKKTNFNGEERSVLNNALAIRVGKNTTAFTNITAWGQTAESMAKYFKKGDELLLKGELRNKKRKLEDGREITTVFILVTGFEFTHGNKPKEENSADGLTAY